MTADTERRERYAQALYATLGFSAERHPWATLAPARREVWYTRADAAIALADEEIAEAEKKAVQAATAQLHAEFDADHEIGRAIDPD